MIQLIKAFWKPIVIVSIFLICSIWIGISKHKDQHPVIPEVVATKSDSAITSRAKIRIAKQDSIIDSLEVRLMVTVAKASDLKAINRGLKQDVDTLRKFYRENHNLQTCDSMVNLQQNYIASIVDELDSLDSEAEQYSRLLYAERGNNAS